MLKDFISAIRGGICSVMGNRYVYNDNKTVWYIDANNLNGYALMQKLPYKDFEYSNVTLDEEKTMLQSILGTPDDSDFGFWVICDLKYTNSSKDKTGNFRLLPLRRNIENSELGYKTSSSKSEKLILDHNDKYEYPIHYRMLKFVVKMGIKVNKVHRIIQFKEDFIKGYIEFITKMRTKAKTEAEKDIFKLLNNSLFIEGCENPLKYLESKILTDDHEILETVSKPTCKDVIGYDSYTLIEYYKKEIQYDKPIYLGSTVLELSRSKVTLYGF